jgi:hypothetical protein
MIDNIFGNDFPNAVAGDPAQSIGGFTTDGTKDGMGAADHDTEYVYRPDLFGMRERARLLILKSKIQAGAILFDGYEPF